MRPLFRTALAVLMLVSPGLGGRGPLSGQTRVEAWGGVSVGSHTATAAALELVPSVSLGALVVRGARPGTSLFAGYLRTSFGCEAGFCQGRNPTVRGNHGALGVEVRRGGPWARLGLLFGTINVGSEGEPAEAGAGMLASAGVTLGNGRVNFLPGVSYRWMSAGTTARPAHAVALSLDLGLGVRLGSLRRR